MAKKGSNVNNLQQKNLIVSTYKEIFILGALNRLDALNTLFKEITIPQAVLEELQKKLSPENVMILLHRINAQEKFRIIETNKNTEYFSRHSNFQMDEGCFCDEYLLSSMFGSSGSNGRGT